MKRRQVRKRYSKVDDAWWYEDPENDSWIRWDNKKKSPQRIPPPQPTLLQRIDLSFTPTSPLGPLVIGIAAVLVALLIAVIAFSGDAESATALLAPVLAAIGAFTGHAAGHAAASRKD